METYESHSTSNLYNTSDDKKDNNSSSFNKKLESIYEDYNKTNSEIKSQNRPSSVISNRILKNNEEEPYNKLINKIGNYIVDNNISESELQYDIKLSESLFYINHLTKINSKNELLILTKYNSSLLSLKNCLKNYFARNSNSQKRSSFAELNKEVKDILQNIAIEPKITSQIQYDKPIFYMLPAKTSNKRISQINNNSRKVSSNINNQKNSFLMSNKTRINQEANKKMSQLVTTNNSKLLINKQDKICYDVIDNANFNLTSNAFTRINKRNMSSINGPSLNNLSANMNKINKENRIFSVAEKSCDESNSINKSILSKRSVVSQNKNKINHRKISSMVRSQSSSSSSSENVLKRKSSIKNEKSSNIKLEIPSDISINRISRTARNSDIRYDRITQNVSSSNKYDTMKFHYPQKKTSLSALIETRKKNAEIRKNAKKIINRVLEHKIKEDKINSYIKSTNKERDLRKLDYYKEMTENINHVLKENFIDKYYSLAYDPKLQKNAIKISYDGKSKYITFKAFESEFNSINKFYYRRKSTIDKQEESKKCLDQSILKNEENKIKDIKDRQDQIKKVLVKTLKIKKRLEKQFDCLNTHVYANEGDILELLIKFVKQ
jgi:hypothetical protein